MATFSVNEGEWCLMTAPCDPVEALVLLSTCRSIGIASHAAEALGDVGEAAASRPGVVLDVSRFGCDNHRARAA